MLVAGAAGGKPSKPSKEYGNSKKRIGRLADPFLFSIKSSLRLVAVDLLEQAGLLGRRLVLLVAAPRGLGLLRLAGLQALHEAIDLAGGVYNSLFAGVEWMTVRADINTQVLLGRMRRPVGAACRANDCGL